MSHCVAHSHLTQSSLPPGRFQKETVTDLPEIHFQFYKNNIITIYSFSLYEHTFVCCFEFFPLLFFLLKVLLILKLAIYRTIVNFVVQNIFRGRDILSQWVSKRGEGWLLKCYGSKNIIADTTVPNMYNIHFYTTCRCTFLSATSRWAPSQYWPLLSPRCRRHNSHDRKPCTTKTQNQLFTIELWERG